MVDEAEVDELLDVVGDVRAQVVATRAQLNGGQFRIADVEEQEGLDGVDVGAALAVELVLDDVQKAAVKTLDEVERFEIERTDRFFLRVESGGCGLSLVFISVCLTVLFGGVGFSPALVRTVSNAHKILFKTQA